MDQNGIYIYYVKYLPLQSKVFKLLCYDWLGLMITLLTYNLFKT